MSHRQIYFRQRYPQLYRCGIVHYKDFVSPNSEALGHSSFKSRLWWLRIYCRHWGLQVAVDRSVLLMPLLYAKAAKEEGNFPLNIEPHSLFQTLFTRAGFQLFTS